LRNPVNKQINKNNADENIRKAEIKLATLDPFTEVINKIK